MVMLYILLQTGKPTPDFITALLLCIVPFILGWLAAMLFYRVSALKARVKELEAETGELNGKVNGLNNDLTDARVRITQLDSELHDKNELVRSIRNQLVAAEADLNVAKYKLAELGHGETPGGADRPTGVTIDNPATRSFQPSAEFGFGAFGPDDLEIVEGIGPKIAELLKDAGIRSWQQLADAEVSRLNEILDAAGPQYRISDPQTWPQQAGLAAQGDWAALRKLQDELSGGRVKS